MSERSFPMPREDDKPEACVLLVGGCLESVSGDPRSHRVWPQSRTSVEAC